MARYANGLEFASLRLHLSFLLFSHFRDPQPLQDHNHTQLISSSSHESIYSSVIESEYKFTCKIFCHVRMYALSNAFALFTAGRVDKAYVAKMSFNQVVIPVSAKDQMHSAVFPSSNVWLCSLSFYSVLILYCSHQLW